MILGLLLELAPFIGPVTSLLGMVTDVVAEPSTGGAMGGIVTTVLFTHKVSPWVDKFVDRTKTKKDDKVWDVISTILSFVTDVLVSFGKLDASEIKKAVTRS